MKVIVGFESFTVFFFELRIVLTVFDDDVM